jgi:hypothetical protein
MASREDTQGVVFRARIEVGAEAPTEAIGMEAFHKPHIALFVVTQTTQLGRDAHTCKTIRARWSSISPFKVCVGHAQRALCLG